MEIFSEFKKVLLICNKWSGIYISHQSHFQAENQAINLICDSVPLLAVDLDIFFNNYCFWK